MVDTSFKPSLQCREGFSLARAVFFMMHRGLCCTDASNLPTPLLGDGATPTRLYSPGSGAVSPERSEACGEDAKACDTTREGPTWIAIS